MLRFGAILIAAAVLVGCKSGPDKVASLCGDFRAAVEAGPAGDCEKLAAGIEQVFADHAHIRLPEDTAAQSNQALLAASRGDCIAGQKQLGACAQHPKVLEVIRNATTPQ